MKLLRPRMLAAATPGFGPIVSAARTSPPFQRSNHVSGSFATAVQTPPTTTLPGQVRARSKGFDVSANGKRGPANVLAGMWE